MRVGTLLGISGLVLMACNPAPRNDGAGKVDIETFAGLMEGVYKTASDNSDTMITDRRTRVDSPDLEGVWFYTQLNTGEAGKLYRQRLSNLTVSDDGQSIIQTAYGLKTPEKYAKAWEDMELLNRLSPEDFDTYFTAGCEQVWTPQKDGAWRGYVDPKTCVINSKRRNQDIRIESEGYLSKDIYRTNERGFDMDMTYLWGSKPGEFIELYSAD